VTGSIAWGNGAGGTHDDEYRKQLHVSCSLFRDTNGNSKWNIIQDWDCPKATPSCCTGCAGDCITTILDENPLFVYPLKYPNVDNKVSAGDTPSTDTENRNYRVMFPSSPAIDSGDPVLAQFEDNGYFPLDEFDVDFDLEDEEVTPALTSKRVLGEDEEEQIDRGAYELPCFLQEGCIGDCVDSAFNEPGDGYIGGADLAVLLGDWGPCSSPCCSDSVGSEFLPPPDGEVGGADLAVLLGAWGPCPCDDPYAESMMMMGGGESDYATGLGPFDNTDIGDLLEALMDTVDEEESTTLIEELLELLGG